MRRLTGNSMLRLVPALILIVALAAMPGCRRRKRHAFEPPPEAEPQSMLGSLVTMSDARSSGQILDGFYTIEDKSWRWSAGKFSVMLRTPRTAAQKGATLVLRFAVSEVILKQLHSQTLTASIGGHALAPQHYKTSGEQTYTRDVPGDWLKSETVKVDFSLDKALPPSAADSRELGVIVSSVGFEAK
jgi:hypothetical protein